MTPQAPATPLRDEQGPLGLLLREAARSFPQELPGQRERAWRALEGAVQRPSRLRRLQLRLRWLFAAASCAAAVAAAAALFWLVRTPARPKVSVAAGPVSVEGDRVQVGPAGLAVIEARGVRAAVSSGSTLLLERGGLRLQSGSAAFQLSGVSLVPVHVGAMDIEARAAVFVAEVSRGKVALFVQEGSVRATGQDGRPVELLAGSSWSDDGTQLLAGPAERELSSLTQGRDATPARAQTLSQLPTAQLIAEDVARVKLAHEHEAQGRPAEAAALFAEVAQHPTERASTALYELARLRLRALHDPAAALSSLRDYQRRFPLGPLASEVALTAVEARLALGDDGLTLREMTDYLQLHGDGDGAAEVHWLRASLFLQQGRCAAASADLRDLLRDPARRDDATFALATCAPEASAASALRDYLRRFPAGRHRRDAAAKLARAR